MYSSQEAGIIPVELKRKQEYKSSYIRPQLVDLLKVKKHIDRLKERKNPHFKDITFDLQDYEEVCAKEDTAGHRLLFGGGDDETMLGEENEQAEVGEQAVDEPDKQREAEEADYRQNDAVRKHQFNHSQTVCLTEIHPESNVVSLAPGEGKIPQNVNYARDFDLKAFAHLNNYDGTNGLFDADRPVKLTPLNYFNQRLLNNDKRFARSSPYLYAAVTYQEGQQIRKNMNISYTTGFQTIGEGGKVVLHHHDAYSVFNNIKNSQKYWRTKKNEILAKIDNFGGFQWFFTLSQADKRWDEIFTAVLHDLPFVTQVETHLIKDKQGYFFTETKVHGMDREPMLLNDFLETLPDSKHEIIRNNVMVATRVFDHRVKAFIKNVVMGRDNPMHIMMYSYRVEFQKRGAAHVHGCLWVDLEKMEKKIPGLARAYQKLRHDKQLSEPHTVSIEEGLKVEDDVTPLTTFIDMFVTCSLHPGTAGGQDVIDKVKDLIFSLILSLSFP